MHIKNILTIWALIILMSCSNSQNSTEENHTETLNTTTEVYAKKFSLQAEDDYFVLKINAPFKDENDTLIYVLKRKTCQIKFDPSYREIIIPINSAAILSASHAALFQPFKKEHLIELVSNKNFFYSDIIHHGIREEKTLEIGGINNLNTELILDQHPELLMVSGTSLADFQKLQFLENNNIKVLINVEWQEPHPLGRSEWIKVMGALLDQEEVADKYFTNVVSNYQRLNASVSNRSTNKMVLVNSPYKENWWMPGGKSYMAQLLNDANINYPWSDIPQANAIQLDLEAVIAKASEADYWLNPGAVISINDLLSKDSRYEIFKPVKTGEIYNYNRRINSLGGNDYYETGIIRPDLILSDLIKIFHPEISNDRNFYFYKKLE